MIGLNHLSVPYRIVLAQLGVGAGVVFIACWFGWSQAGAAALAVLVVALPNAWLAWRVTGSGMAKGNEGKDDQSGARILALSLTKFVTTAGAAALALATLKPAMAGFFAGLVVTVLTAAVVPPFLAPQQLARVPQLD